MEMELSQDYREFIELLNKNDVKYIVVGGYAVAQYGYVRYTGDIDFWVKPEHSNAERVVKSLIEFGFGSLDISVLDLLKDDEIIQLGYPPQRIDIITGVTGLNFDECWKEITVIEFENLKLNFLSLHHLKINKEASGRDKDLNDLRNLNKIKTQ
jgi:uncharacterized nucleotidyltransferase DUF6036